MGGDLNARAACSLEIGRFVLFDIGIGAWLVPGIVEEVAAADKSSTALKKEEKKKKSSSSSLEQEGSAQEEEERRLATVKVLEQLLLNGVDPRLLLLDRSSDGGAVHRRLRHPLPRLHRLHRRPRRRDTASHAGP